MVVTDKIMLNDWHVVATAQECQKESFKKVKLLEEDLILWRSNDAESTIRVWQDRCPHRSVPLSLGKIVDDTIVCGYHGWQYDNCGKCINIPSNPNQTPPATAKIKTYQCQERYGLIWVCLGEPSKDIPSFPEWNDSSYRKVFLNSYECHTSPFRALENAFDASHFCFAHDGIAGDSQRAEIDYEVEANADGITVTNLKMWQPDQDGTGVGGYVTYSQKITHPLTLYVDKTISQGRLAFLFTVTPVGEEDCIFWMWLAMNYGDETPDLTLCKFQDELFSQDAPILEAHRPIRLPLPSKKNAMRDFPPELHTHSDRSSIAYRRWLKDLGVTFGVC